MIKSELKYFLAANSAEGFVSAFNKCYEANNGWRAYIIKGGPGTGKSSFMKKIAEKARQENEKYELFPCSSDPNSLDAVILPEKKVVILDGTSPHTVDPVYPGVCEEILNFGEFWKTELLLYNAKEIIKLTDKNKSLHRSASRYLQAAGSLLTDNLKTIALSTDKAKTSAFAKKLCKRYIPKGIGIGYEWERFLEGITPQGIVSFSDTVLSSCQNTVIIEDAFGSVSNIIMNRIREYALSNGYDIISIKNALLPLTLLDGVIIPELSLCFIRESGSFKINSPIRRIHARRFISDKALSRKRLKFNKKAIASLLSSATKTLSLAKSVHDELESLYIKAMDFDSLSRFADEFSQKLF